MKRTFIVAGLCLCFSACAPTALVHTTQRITPISSSEGFLVIKETEKFDAAATELGDIQIKDAGLAVNCDYDMVVALATKKAQQLGANVLKIYEHRLPSPLGSTCHRIKAKALHVPDLTPYEKEVLWSPSRRLKQADFKGSIENRPFEAATNAGIRYYYTGQVFQGSVQLTIETYFDCQNSYFKGTHNAPFTLAHEQVHFDIVELHARRLAKTLQEQAPNTKELERNQEGIYRQIMSEAQLMQDKYDSEVYADPTKLSGWVLKIEQELTALQAYAGKQFRVKIKV